MNKEALMGIIEYLEARIREHEEEGSDTSLLEKTQKSYADMGK